MNTPNTSQNTPPLSSTSSQLSKEPNHSANPSVIKLPEDTTVPKIASSASSNETRRDSAINTNAPAFNSSSKRPEPSPAQLSKQVPKDEPASLNPPQVEIPPAMKAAMIARIEALKSAPIAPFQRANSTALITPPTHPTTPQFISKIDIPGSPTPPPQSDADSTNQRIKAKMDMAEEDRKKKRRITAFAESLDRPKPLKGEYIQKLKEMQFEKLSDAEAKIAYEILQSRLTKHSLQRNLPIKTLFTRDEFDALATMARKLDIEKARLVRKLCFTGDASAGVLDIYEKIRVELSRIGNNINQIAHALNLKKSTFSDATKQQLDKELKDVRAQIVNLERRLSR